jgi:hypothetical protein
LEEFKELSEKERDVAMLLLAGGIGYGDFDTLKTAHRVEHGTDIEGIRLDAPFSEAETNRPVLEKWKAILDKAGRWTLIHHDKLFVYEDATTLEAVEAFYSEKQITPITMPWSPSLTDFPVLSVRQPMAWFIMAGFKDIENRSKRLKYRGPLLIHAGKSTEACTQMHLDHFEETYGVCAPDELDFGGIVGMVDMIDCVESHKSRWFKGPFGYVLANPRFPSFRPCPGQVGLFRMKQTT